MLHIGHTQSVSFKVNVMGTSSNPKVRLILGTNPEISFDAVKGAEENWGAEITIPKTVDPGSYDLRVEVILNNRLFTPLQKRIEISLKPDEAVLPVPDDVLPGTMSNAVEQPIQADPVASFEVPTLPKVDAPSLLRSFEKPSEPKKQIVMPKVVAKMPKIVPKPQTTDEPKVQEHAELPIPPIPPMSKLESVLKMKPHTRRKEPRTQVPAEPIRVKISEINAITSKIASKIVETAPAQSVHRDTPARPSIPVKLIKEQAFFE